MLFNISEPSSCCYSISFLGYWHSHSSNFCSLWIQASHCNRQCLIRYNRADRRALLDINQNTCIQRKWLYIILLQGRQRKNIGRLLRNFYNFELASKCELPGNNDMDVSEQLQELVCSVTGVKGKGFFTSFQAGHSVSWQTSELMTVYMKYVEKTWYSQLLHTRPWVDS